MLTPAVSFAESYDDVIYKSGYPGFLPGPFFGTLSVADNGVSFKTRTGKHFLIDRRAICQFGYSGSIQKPGYGLTLAGPNPIALGASLGVTLLENTLFRAKAKSNLLYSIHFVTPESEDPQEVIFKVPDESTAKKLMADIQAFSKKTQPVEPESAEIPAVLKQ